MNCKLEKEGKRRRWMCDETEKGKQNFKSRATYTK
jgi:hypothetical protein